MKLLAQDHIAEWHCEDLSLLCLISEIELVRTSQFAFQECTSHILDQQATLGAQVYTFSISHKT